MNKSQLLNCSPLQVELLKEKSRLEAVLAALPIGVFIIDKSSQFTHMNDIVYEIWGENALLAEGISEYNSYTGWWYDSGKQIKGDEWAAARALRGEKSIGEIIKIKSFDDKIKTILNSASPIYDIEGKIDGAVVVISDITNMKQMEQELHNHKNYLTDLVKKRTFELEELNQKLKCEIKKRGELEKQIRHLDQLNLVGQMAAGLGHEIRNPMTTIKGFFQIFKNNKEFEQYSDILNLMNSELDRINDIISEFLSLAKNKKVDKKECCINNIISTIIPLIQSDFLLANKNLEYTLQQDIPLLFLDEDEIKQLVFNLVRNGNEAMRQGQTLTISTYFKNNNVTLSIKDEGQGVGPDLLEEISKPFFTTKPHGTGLGLPICYSIVQRHNAVIEVESSSSGTIFYVKFKTN